jgi:phosphoglycolate phosphatase
MTVDSIIFDLDGTLWDSTQGIMDSWNLIIQKDFPERKLLTKEDLQSLMGLQLPDIAEKLFSDLDKESRESLLTTCCTFENEYLKEKGWQLYEGVEETIKALSKDYKLCIVSNCQAGYIETFFEATGLGDYFIDFENPGRTGLSKGENIRLVVERNELKNPIYVGDTAGDYKAANQAKVPFVFAKYGFGEVEYCNMQLEAFTDLEKQMHAWADQ